MYWVILLAILDAFAHTCTTMVLLDMRTLQGSGATGSFVRFCSEAELPSLTIQTMNSGGIAGLQNALASNSFQIQAAV